MSAGTRVQDIRRVELTGALSELFEMRARIAPVMVVLLGVFTWYEPATWRRAVFLVALPTMFAVLIYEGVRARRGTIGAGAASGNAAIMPSG